MFQLQQAAVLLLAECATFYGYLLLWYFENVCNYFCNCWNKM